jgi:hypothetical protein
VDEREAIEIAKCSVSTNYYIQTYCQIYDATSETWLPFHLWPAQQELLTTIPRHNQHIWLKARQIGLTWLSIAYALWLIRFGDETTVNLFSRRDDEASELMWRLQEMHSHTPEWLQAQVQIKSTSKFKLKNRGRAHSFPTTKNSGRSYTSTLAIIDEADYIPFLGSLLNAIKPTVDAGGKLIILSSADKSAPNSKFKKIYKEAMTQKNNYTPAFYSWRARPDRDEKWFTRQTADYTIDDLWQEYPETDTQALAQLEQSKRFSAHAIIPHISTKSPKVDHHSIHWIDTINPNTPYLIVCDPAEGTATGDISAISVIDINTWSEIATWGERCEIVQTVEVIEHLANTITKHGIVVERNNHGHAIIALLKERGVIVTDDPFDKKTGWLTTARSKVLIMTNFAEQLQTDPHFTLSKVTADQLSDIDQQTLRAASGNHDDHAIAYLIGIAYLRYRPAPTQSKSVLIRPK